MSLVPGVDVRRAANLPANRQPKVCFQGQTPGVTKGFTLDADQRAALIKKDPSVERYIYPFLGGDELLHKLTIDRWVIDLSTQTPSRRSATPRRSWSTYARRSCRSARRAAAKEARQNA